MIDKNSLSDCLGIYLTNDVFFKCLGYTNSKKENTLSFCDNKKYITDIDNNPNIRGVFVTEHLSQLIMRKDILILRVEDPRYNFYTLYNYISKLNYIKKANLIHPTAKIHPNAYIGEFNIEIGENVVIEPNACVLEDVYIGDNSRILPGAVIGTEGFEQKVTTKGILTVAHHGKVIIKSNVEIGSNSCVAKGMYMFGDTIIDDYTKINTLVRVAHCVRIGKNCLIHGCVSISGSVVVSDDAWIGPNSTISNGLIIGKNARVSIGAVVTKDVLDNTSVSGNFAVEHSKFLQFIKSFNNI